MNPFKYYNICYNTKNYTTNYLFVITLLYFLKRWNNLKQCLYTFNYYRMYEVKD